MLLVCLNTTRRRAAPDGPNAGKRLPFITRAVDGESHAVAFTPEEACKFPDGWGQFVPAEVATAAGYELALFNAPDSDGTPRKNGITVQISGDSSGVQHAASAVTHALRRGSVTAH